MRVQLASATILRGGMFNSNPGKQAADGGLIVRRAAVSAAQAVFVRHFPIALGGELVIREAVGVGDQQIVADGGQRVAEVLLRPEGERRHGRLGKPAWESGCRQTAGRSEDPGGEAGDAGKIAFPPCLDGNGAQHFDAAALAVAFIVDEEESTVTH